MRKIIIEFKFLNMKLIIFNYKFNKKCKFNILKKLILILLYLYNIQDYNKITILKIKNLRIIKNRTLLSFTKNNEDLLFKLEKEKLLEYISKSVGKNITNVRQIYLKKKLRFGNQIILIYKLIFYCQILGCKKIIIDKNPHNWFIKNTILNKQYRMKIEVSKDKKIKEFDFDTLIDKTSNFFYYSYLVKPKINFELLRDEIFKNLPKISTNINIDSFI